MGNAGFFMQIRNKQCRTKGKEKCPQHGIKFQQSRKPDAPVGSVRKSPAYHEHFFLNNQIAHDSADNTAQNNDTKGILQKLVFK